MSYFGTTEFMLRVAAGLVPGYSSVNKFGANPAAAGLEDIWTGGGVYAFYPTSAQSMEILSDDANDTSAGTGGRTVTIYGLDDTWADVSETVTLNGTSTVALVNTYRRMYRATVDTAGTGEVNAGNITIRIAGAGTTGAYILAGNGQTQQAIYTIPLGKTAAFVKGYITMMSGARTGDDATYRQYMRFNNGTTGAWQVKGEIALFNLGSSQWQYEYGVPAGMIPEKTDIRLTQTESSDVVSCQGGFDLILIDNTLLV